MLRTSTVRVTLSNGAVDLRQRLRVPDIGDGQILRAHMIQVLCGRELREHLHHARIPAGHVARQVFEHRRGALAPAEADGIGHFGAGAERARGQSIHRPVADQVADIGDDPLGAGLDELIVVQLRQILVQDRDLAAIAESSARKRAALLGVAYPIDGGQKPRQLVNVEAHGLTPAS